MYNDNSIIYVFMIIVGLAICFGGGLLKKPVAIATGLLNGSLLGLIVVLLISLNTYDSEGHFVIVIIFAIGGAVISAMYDRICAAISVVGSSLVFLLILVLMVCDYETLTMGLVIAVVGAIAASIVSYIYYNYAFAITTAFTGALIASIGFTFVSSGQSIEDYAYSVLWGEPTGFTTIILVTVVLTLAGAIFQVKGVKPGTGVKHKFDFPEMGSLKFNSEQSFVEEIKSYPLSFYIPIISYLTLVILYHCTIYVPGGGYLLYNILYWLMIIVEGIFVACVAYAALNFSIKYSVILQIAYAVGYAIYNMYSFGWAPVATVVCMFSMTIIWFVVSIIKSNIKDEPKKRLLAIIISPIIFVTICCFSSGYFYFSGYFLIAIAAAIISFILIFKIYGSVKYGYIATAGNTNESVALKLSNEKTEINGTEDGVKKHVITPLEDK